MLELARRDDGRLLETLRASQRRTNFRPLLPGSVNWAISLTPHIQETRRELTQQLQVAWRTGDQRRAMEAWRRLRQLGSSQPSLLQREHALQILLRELDNRSAEAERLRRDYFPDWQPPRLTNEPATLLTRALQRFEALRRDAREEEVGALAQLEQSMRQLGEKDASAALHRLDRLPFYAEQLLR